MRCKDAMRSGVEAFREDDPVRVIALRMRDVGTDFVPVCDPGGRPVGVVTAVGIVRGVCTADLLASKVPARDVMEDHPARCFETDEVERAEELMNETKRPQVLVCEERTGRLVGAITLAEILRDEGEEHRAVEVARQVVEGHGADAEYVS